MGLGKRLTAILFPPRCMFCRRILDEGNICPACRDRLPRCGPVKGRGEFFSQCAAALYYVDDVRRALLLFKFRGRQAFAVGLGGLMAETVREHLAGTYDLITWAPVSDKRRRRRGYDQSELLCRAMAKSLGETYVRTLRKVRHTAANSTIDTPEARAANVLGAYEAADPEVVRGRRILLVDDIYTTGATLSECARMLLMAGAEDVICCTAAARPPAKKRKN